MTQDDEDARSTVSNSSTNNKLSYMDEEDKQQDENLIINEQQTTSADQQQLVNRKKKHITKYIITEGLDWHTVAKVFLHPIVRVFFEITILAQVCFTMIIYSIAGPTSYAQLIGRKEYFVYMIGPFVFFLAFFVILFHKCIRQIISVATIVKASLLLLLILVSGVVGAQINRYSDSHWPQTLRPLLVATVTLGGVLNIYPVIYSKIQPTRQNIQIVMLSVICGIVACGVIVFTWVYFVLKIVPQRSAVQGGPSLEKSLQAGEIATVPMIEVMQQAYPQLTSVGMFAQLFILTSITVSFVTYSTALKHMLDGYVKSFTESVQQEDSLLSKLQARVPLLCNPTLFKYSLYFIFFLIIYLVAQFNPSRLFLLIEMVNANAINLETGIFVTIIAVVSWLPRHKVKVPVELPWALRGTVFLCTAFSLFSLVYFFISRFVYV